MELNETTRNILLDQFKEPININIERIQAVERILTQYDEQKQFLAELPNALKKPVLVPVGTKGFLRGNLVHTNEILHNIGCDYLVKRTAKQAIDACNRKTEEAKDYLMKLKEENRWLEQRLDEMINKNAFGSDDSREIIETYDEEKEKEWRIRHRESVRAMKLKESEERAQNQMSDDDVFSMLDVLELEEELNEFQKNESEIAENTPAELKEKDKPESETMDDNRNNICETIIVNKIPEETKNENFEILQSNSRLQKIEEELYELENNKKPIVVEKDVMKRLDELEREEELLDEMEMLEENSTEVTECSSDSTNSSEKSTTIRFSDDIDWKVYDTNEDIISELERTNGERNNTNINKDAETIEPNNECGEEDMPVTLHLRFSHSDNKPAEFCRNTEEITRPSDFYNRAFRPKSILKNKDRYLEEPQNCRSQSDPPLKDGVCNRNWVCFDSFSKSGNDSDQENLNVVQVPAVTDVKEKTESSVAPVTSAPRKRQSRFSVSRAVLPKK